MEISSVPIIIVVCYMLAEVFKIVFKNKKELYKLIPILVSCVGGIFGILIYISNPKMIFYANNIWSTMLIGITSGASSTTTNQIIKQLFKKSNEEKDYE